ncbi:MAG: hypothetical protein PVG22_07535 [Chromatiales bacterium]|jgi:hypothetical protein
MNDEQVTWSELAVDLYDKLTGRGAEITYRFENLEIFIPNKVDPDPKYAKWRLNGVLKISAKDNSTTG